MQAHQNPTKTTLSNFTRHDIVMAEIDQLTNKFAHFEQNFTDEIKKSYRILQDSTDPQKSTSNTQTQDESKIADNAIKAWQAFIRDHIINNANAAELMIKDVKKSPEAQKHRYRTLAHQFHPDRNKDKLILTNEIAKEMMQVITSDTVKLVEQETYSIDELIRRAEADIKCYEKSETDAYLENAIDKLKKALLALHDNIQFDALKTSLNGIKTHAKITGLLASCLVAQRREFEAQACLISSLKIIDQCIPLFDSSKTDEVEHRDKFKSLKKAIEAETANLKSKSIKSDPQFVKKQAPKGDAQQEKPAEKVMVILPESKMIKYRYDTVVIKHADDYKKVTEYAGRGLQVVGVVGGGTLVAMGVGNAILGVTSIASIAVLGPLAWFSGGMVAIAGGLYSGYKAIETGEQIAIAADKVKELNDVIDMAMTCYTDHNHQSFLNVLANRDNYSLTGTPLIKYDRESIHHPIDLVDTHSNVNLVDTLLKYGFRPDGIAFLINTIVEVVLSGQISTNAEITSSRAFILTILHTLINDKKLKETAASLDKEIKSLSEEEREKINAEGIKGKKNWKNIQNTMLGKYDKVITKQYIEDYNSLTITERLQEMINIAKINYALVHFIDSSSSRVPMIYMDEVESYYENRKPNNDTNRKLAIVREIMFSLNLINKSIHPSDICEGELKHLWTAHVEAKSTNNANQLSNLVLPQVDAAIKELSTVSKETDKYELVQLALAVDKLKITVANRNVQQVRNDLVNIGHILGKSELSVGDQSKYIYKVLLNAYELINNCKLNKKSKKYLTLELGRLSNKELAQTFNTLNQVSLDKGGLDSKNTSKNTPKNHPDVATIEEALQFILRESNNKFIIIVISPIFNRKNAVEQIELLLPIHGKTEKSKLSNVTSGGSFPTLNLYLKDMTLQQLMGKWLFLDEASPDLTLFARIIQAILLPEHKLIDETKRKAVFKEIIDGIKLLKNFNPNTSAGLIPSFISDHVSDDQLRNYPDRYYTIAYARLDNLFPNDIKIYMRSRTALVTTGLFAKTNSNIELADFIAKRVIGQPFATKLLTDILLDFKKFNSSVKPCSMLLCGPTGVGKTELAHCAADAINSYINPRPSNIRPLVVFHMEEFSADISVTKINGSHPPYVGSQDLPHFAKALVPFESNQSTRDLKIIENVVILFDELEKAHPEVKQTLLGLFDKGEKQIKYVNGSTNVEIKYVFKNCLFMATTNLLANEIIKDHQSKLSGSEIAKNFKSLSLNLPTQRGFSGELLNRMNIVPFGPIPRGQDYQSIVKLHLLTQLKKLEADYKLKSTEIDSDVLQQILVRLEREHYNGGVGVRSFIMWLENVFRSFFTKFDSNSFKENPITLKFGYDNNEDDITLSLVIHDFQPIVIDSDAQGNKYYMRTEETVSALRHAS